MAEVSTVDIEVSTRDTEYEQLRQNADYAELTGINNPNYTTPPSEVGSGYVEPVNYLQLVDEGPNDRTNSEREPVNIDPNSHKNVPLPSITQHNTTSTHTANVPLPTSTTAKQTKKTKKAKTKHTKESAEKTEPRRVCTRCHIITAVAVVIVVIVAVALAVYFTTKSSNTQGMESVVVKSKLHISV